MAKRVTGGEGPRPFLYTLETPDGVTFSLASDTWLGLLGTLYTSVAVICDKLGMTSTERGDTFADLPGGLEPPTAFTYTLYEQYVLKIEVNL